MNIPELKIIMRISINNNTIGKSFECEKYKNIKTMNN